MARRTVLVSLPLTVEEHAALLAHAEREGVSVARACRAVLADAGVFPPPREVARRQTTLTVRITDAQHTALEEHAAAAGTSTAELIRSTLKEAGLFEDTGQRVARSMGGRPPGRKGAEGTNITVRLTYDERAALESQAAAREEVIAAVVRTALDAAGLFRRRRRRH